MVYMGLDLSRFSVTFGAMGRPPLNLQQTLVRLPKDAAGRIDTIAGKKNRAKFIREAVMKELERLEKKTANAFAARQRK